MKKFSEVFLASVLSVSLTGLAACGDSDRKYDGDFSAKVVLEPTASDPEVRKVITCFDEEIDAAVNSGTFQLKISEQTVEVSDAYTCSVDGEKTNGASRYVAFEISGAPTMFHVKMSKTGWVDTYVVSMRLNEGKTVQIGKTEYTKVSVQYNAVRDYVCPPSDVYVKDAYTYKLSGKNITLQRALYTPEQAKADGDKNPLIVWLHGLGEGGSDINIPLIKDNTVALSSPAIQKYFTTDTQKGAYVAVIQCPTFWLDQSGKGNMGELAAPVTGKGQPSYYTEALVGAIDQYLQDNSDIDPDRIYLAGCSNGGYMVMNLAVDYGDKYAAYVPICEGYMNGNLTDEKIDELKDRNLWFVQSDDDGTVKPWLYVIPTYYRLIDAGAQNVKCSLLTGFGHSCWSQFFADQLNFSFDAQAVKEDFANVRFNEDGSIDQDANVYVCNKNCVVDEGSLFAWLAKQRRNDSYNKEG